MGINPVRKFPKEMREMFIFFNRWAWRVSFPHKWKSFFSNGVKSQSIAEYVIIVAAVASAMMAMQTYLKRGIQSVIRVQADLTSEEAGGQEGSLETEFDPRRNPGKSLTISQDSDGTTDKSRTTQETTPALTLDSMRSTSASGHTFSWSSEFGEGEIEND